MHNMRSHVLLVAPPGWGKSTVLRQLAGSRVPTISVEWDEMASTHLQREIAKLADTGPPLQSGDRQRWRGVAVVDGALPQDGFAARLHECCRVATLGGLQLVVAVDGHSDDRLVIDEHCVLLAESELAFSRLEVESYYESALGPHDELSHMAEEGFRLSSGHPELLTRILRSHAACLLGNGSRSSCEEVVTAWLRESVPHRLCDRETEAFLVASLLGSGSRDDLSGLGVHDPESSLTRAARTLPVMEVVVTGGTLGFQAQPSASRFAADCLAECPELAANVDPTRLVGVLTDAGRFREALRLTGAWYGSSETAEFLTMFGSDCLRAGLHKEIAVLLRDLPVKTAMSSPSLLLTWAEVLLEAGRPSDALGKARGAALLAEHAAAPGVFADARRRSADALSALGMTELARRELTGALLHPDLRLNASHIAVLHTARLKLLIADGEYDQARAEIRHLEGLSAAMSADTSRDVSLLASLVPAICSGDFRASAAHLAPLAAGVEGWQSHRATARGNLAVVLIEMGRVRRSHQILRQVVDAESHLLDAHFAPALGCVEAAIGASDGLGQIRAGVEAAISMGDESTVAQNRVYESIVLRAAGRLDDSLTSAERAYERLCVQDCMSFRRLAALEVAASLLAMGDVRAARAWAEPIVAEGFGDNLHHATRGAMILAECDRRDGKTQDGVTRLTALADHIQSENSNWQMAMYCRAFPHILGMLAAAVGSEGLPAHMLRMILPEHKEGCLRGARTLITQPEWELLGRRLLGDEHFEAYVKRGGRPVCTVRMFGGLEVSVDGKAIREKDWRKRKSRILFAMLVARRGHDISRDQILEHLWPELDDSRAKNNFYVAWSTMKGALMGEAKLTGPCPYVESVRGRCRVVRDSVWSDVEDFEDALKEMRRADSKGESDVALAAADRLSAVYRGELLPGDLYDDWFSTLRDRYRIEFSDAMLRAVTLLLERDDPCEAVVYARRGISTDPYREDLYQAALSAHIAAGQRSAAIETFLQCRTQLSEELGLDPSAKTYDLYSQVLAMEECPRVDTYGLPPVSESDRESW